MVLPPYRGEILLRPKVEVQEVLQIFYKVSGEMFLWPTAEEPRAGVRVDRFTPAYETL
jgi:hypothetical protein